MCYLVFLLFLSHRYSLLETSLNPVLKLLNKLPYHRVHKCLCTWNPDESVLYEDDLDGDNTFDIVDPKNLIFLMMQQDDQMKLENEQNSWCTEDIFN